LDHPGQARRCAAASGYRGKDADADGFGIADCTSSTAALDCRTGSGSGAFADAVPFAVAVADRAVAVTYPDRADCFTDRAVTYPD
jgi:hypothetical protein